MPFLGDRQLFESYFGSHPVTSVSANKYPHQHIKDVIRYYRSSYIHTYIRAYIHTYVHTYHTIPYHYHYHSHSHSHYITLHTYIHTYIHRNIHRHICIHIHRHAKNKVLLVQIEGPVWYTIYHHLPVVKGVNKPVY